MVSISGGLGTFAPQPVTEIQEGQSPTEHTKVCRRYARCNLPNLVCPCTPITLGCKGHKQWAFVSGHGCHCR